MDLVSRIHLEELLASPALEVVGLVAMPSTVPVEAGSAPASVGNVSIVAADAERSLPPLNRTVKKAVYALTSCGAMFAFSFRSSVARDMIRKALSPGHHDVVVVDHFNTLANIRLRDLRKSRAKIIFILHDIMPFLLRETARLKHRWHKTALFGLEAYKAAYVERRMLKLASAAVFLSGDDLAHYHGMCTHTVAILPIPAEKNVPSPQRAIDRTLLFAGSPNYTPNAIAIEWLKAEFAPRLEQADPSIRIVLTGRGTETIDCRPRNIDALGYVCRTELTRLTDSSIAMICPVGYGGGLKIKVLEALARGCLVFATTNALRGFEQFSIEPVITVSDPAGSVERVVRLCRNEAALADMRARLVTRWNDCSSLNQGALARLIELVAQAA